MVREGGPSNDAWEENATSDRFEEDIETAVEYRPNRAKVKRKVRDSEPLREGNQDRRVRGLQEVLSITNAGKKEGQERTSNKEVARISGTQVICMPMFVGLWW